MYFLLKLSPNGKTTVPCPVHCTSVSATTTYNAPRRTYNIGVFQSSACKVCIKSPCTASTALLALIEVHGLLIQTLYLPLSLDLDV